MSHSRSMKARSTAILGINRAPAKQSAENSSGSNLGLIRLLNKLVYSCTVSITVVTKFMGTGESAPSRRPQRGEDNGRP